jgi:NADH-quinone oxidoreductase subunit M
VLAVISASVVVLTAAYILWALQRVYLGAEYRGPHEEHITPSTLRENLIGLTLLAFAILFGVFPYQTVLKYMDATIDRQTQELADWTQTVKENPEAPGYQTAASRTVEAPWQVPAVAIDAPAVAIQSPVVDAQSR